MLKARAPCCVRNCTRTSQAENEFCLKCWTLLEDEERAGYLYALHAPFWSRSNLGRYRRRDEDKPEAGWEWLGEMDEPGDCTFADPDMPEGAFRLTLQNGLAGIDFLDVTSGKRAASMSFGHLLRELEHRTTRDAIAKALWSRMWSASIAQIQNPEPESP